MGIDSHAIDVLGGLDWGLRTETPHAHQVLGTQINSIAPPARRSYVA